MDNSLRSNTKLNGYKFDTRRCNCNAWSEVISDQWHNYGFIDILSISPWPKTRFLVNKKKVYRTQTMHFAAQQQRRIIDLEKEDEHLHFSVKYHSKLKTEFLERRVKDVWPLTYFNDIFRLFWLLKLICNITILPHQNCIRFNQRNENDSPETNMFNLMHNHQKMDPNVRFHFAIQFKFAFNSRRWPRRSTKLIRIWTLSNRFVVFFCLSDTAMSLSETRWHRGSRFAAVHKEQKYLRGIN